MKRKEREVLSLSLVVETLENKNIIAAYEVESGPSPITSHDSFEKLNDDCFKFVEIYITLHLHACMPSSICHFCPKSLLALILVYVMHAYIKFS